jgi:hypothetical protein
VAAFERPGLEGTLVVGTDGLFKYVAQESIAARCAGELTGAAEDLVVSCKLPSGAYPDDVAVVLVRSQVPFAASS